MFIEKIEIKNFRSIVDQAIKGNNLVIFVGKNDVGKSNVLRALNLFFNNETEVNTAFDFQSDFSKIAKIGKNKAKEILIRITFSPPETFRDHVKKVVWTKKWRENGTFLDGEKIRYGDGTEITNRSRLYTWIRRLKYHYVPAIKSNDYFSKLLSVLYETLYATIRADLQGAGKKFIEKIQEHTNTLSSEILARINLTSRIQLPENLSSLFSTLDFETFLKNDVISLRNRGDGIKVRHIPVILKFLADKEEMHHAMGAVRSNTIWGYEEPENNLELQQAFELSRNFNEYSSDIQIFLTTHSAAFYSVEASAPVITKYYASKRPQDSSTEYAIIADSQLEQTDSEMGLMPLVAPYIKKKADES
jgi:predicted ATP-dependent endonuclease of OLD family